MTFYLPDDGTLSTDDLADRFNLDEDDIPAADDPTGIAHQVGIALVLVDDLMGDDPTKYKAQQALVSAFAAVADQQPDGHEVALRYDDTEIALDVTKPDE
jgi:hypothetical protein